MIDEKRKKQLLWQLPFLALLIVGTVLIVRQQQPVPYQHNEGTVFGTFYRVTYQCDSDLLADINAELGRVDKSLSPFNEQSTITAVNQNRPVQLDTMFTYVFNLAMQVSKETDGAFDITVAPLVNAWGFGFKNGEMPNARQVDSLRQLTGYQKVQLRDGRVEKADPRMMLDCSAIAKGYGCDAVARLFDRCGIDNYMVEIGGEVVTKGISQKRVPWKIGINKPVDDPANASGEIQSVLNVTDRAMATSGNYRNFYYRDGKKYAHTIDPRTGYPVQHSILSATVLAPDCATADAYATSFMVMGLDKARSLLERHPELTAYLIYADENGGNAVWCSPALEESVQK